MDGIVGRFTAAGDVDEVVSYSGIMANISSGGNIGRIRTWGDIGSAAHAITATDTIYEIYSGGDVTATVSAQTVGTVAEHNRTQFIDRPVAPSLPMAELRAKSAEAYASLVKMGDEFDASAVELVEMQAAALAEIAKTAVQSAERIEELRAESQARVDDIGKQVALAEIEAQQQTDRAFELAQVAAEAAQKATVAAVARASARADRQFAATEGELEAGKKAVEQEAAYLTAKKNQILVYRGEEQYAAGEARKSLLATAEPTFAGLFFDQMKEYSLDWVQDKLRGVATVAAFIPGVGWLISGMAGVADGAITYYRGDRVGGLIEIGLSAIPLVGRFGKLARAVTSTGGRIGSGLRGNVLCPTIGKFIKGFCFVEGTMVIDGEERVMATEATVGQEADSRWYLALAVGAFAAAGIIGYETGRRSRDRRRQALDAVDLLFTQLDEDELPDEDFGDVPVSDRCNDSASDSIYGDYSESIEEVEEEESLLAVL